MKGGHALHAEWTKQRTVPGTGWLLLAVVSLTAAVSVAADLAARCPAAGCPLDPARTSLTGTYLGQAVVAILAVLVISGEYGSGLIHLTLAATPRRLTMLAAKAVTLTAVILPAALLAVAGSVLAARLILPGHGFTAAHGFPALLLSGGPMARAAFGTVLYLGLIALLSLGVATAVRDAAAAIGIVLGLLYVFPIIAAVVTVPAWHRHLEQFAPMTAGLAIQDTTSLSTAPVAPWTGLGILGAWAAAALLTGALLLRWRDA
jgi:ABC-2 type transport system permease protein